MVQYFTHESLLAESCVRSETRKFTSDVGGGLSGPRNACGNQVFRVRSVGGSPWADPVAFRPVVVSMAPTP